MAIPASAKRFSDQMDPGDRYEFIADYSGLLQQGEQIAVGEWTLIMSAEGAAVGLSIIDSGPRAPALGINNTRLIFWMEIDPDFQGDAVFDSGIDVAITVRFETTNVPARRYERTIVVRVINQ